MRINQMTIWYVRADCCAIAYFQLRYVEAFCLYGNTRCMTLVPIAFIEYSKSSWKSKVKKKHTHSNNVIHTQHQEQHQKIKTNHDNRMCTVYAQRTPKGEQPHKSESRFHLAKLYSVSVCSSCACRYDFLFWFCSQHFHISFLCFECNFNSRRFTLNLQRYTWA